MSEKPRKKYQREDVRRKLKEIKIELLPAQKGLLQGFFDRKNKGRTEDEFRAGHIV